MDLWASKTIEEKGGWCIEHVKKIRSSLLAFLQKQAKKNHKDISQGVLLVTFTDHAEPEKRVNEVSVITYQDVVETGHEQLIAACQERREKNSFVAQLLLERASVNAGTPEPPLWEQTLTVTVPSSELQAIHLQDIRNKHVKAVIAEDGSSESKAYWRLKQCSRSKSAEFLSKASRSRARDRDRDRDRDTNPSPASSCAKYTTEDTTTFTSATELQPRRRSTSASAGIQGRSLLKSMRGLDASVTSAGSMSSVWSEPKRKERRHSTTAISQGERHAPSAGGGGGAGIINDLFTRRRLSANTVATLNALHNISWTPDTLEEAELNPHGSSDELSERVSCIEGNQKEILSRLTSLEKKHSDLEMLQLISRAEESAKTPNHIDEFFHGLPFSKRGDRESPEDGNGSRCSSRYTASSGMLSVGQGWVMDDTTQNRVNKIAEEVIRLRKDLELNLKYLSTQLESQGEQSDSRIRQLDAAVEQLTSDTEAECALRERVATLEAKTEANIDSSKRWNDKLEQNVHQVWISSLQPTVEEMQHKLCEQMKQEISKLSGGLSVVQERHETVRGSVEGMMKDVKEEVDGKFKDEKEIIQSMMDQIGKRCEIMEASVPGTVEILVERTIDGKDSLMDLDVCRTLVDSMDRYGEQCKTLQDTLQKLLTAPRSSPTSSQIQADFIRMGDRLEGSLKKWTDNTQELHVSPICDTVDEFLPSLRRKWADGTTFIDAIKDSWGKQVDKLLQQARTLKKTAHDHLVATTVNRIQAQVDKLKESNKDWNLLQQTTLIQLEALLLRPTIISRNDMSSDRMINAIGKMRDVFSSQCSLLRQFINSGMAIATDVDTLTNGGKQVVFLELDQAVRSVHNAVHDICWAPSTASRENFIPNCSQGLLDCQTFIEQLVSSTNKLVTQTQYKQIRHTDKSLSRVVDMLAHQAELYRTRLLRDEEVQRQLFELNENIQDTKPGSARFTEDSGQLRGVISQAIRMDSTVIETAQQVEILFTQLQTIAEESEGSAAEIHALKDGLRNTKTEISELKEKTHEALVKFNDGDYSFDGVQKLVEGVKKDLSDSALLNCAEQTQQLAADFGLLKAEAQEMHYTLQAVTEQQSSMTNSINELNRQTCQLPQILQDTEEMKAKVDEIHDEFIQHSNLLSKKMQDDIGVLDGKAMSMVNEVDKVLQTKLNETTATLNAVIQKSEDNFLVLDSKLQAAISDIDAADTSISSLKQHVVKLQGDVLHHTDALPQVERLQRQVKTLSEDLSPKSMVTSDATIEKLKEDNRELTRSVHEIVEDLSGLKVKIDCNLDPALSRLQEELSDVSTTARRSPDPADIEAKLAEIRASFQEQDMALEERVIATMKCAIETAATQSIQAAATLVSDVEPRLAASITEQQTALLQQNNEHIQSKVDNALSSVNAINETANSRWAYAVESLKESKEEYKQAVDTATEAGDKVHELEKHIQALHVVINDNKEGQLESTKAFRKEFMDTTTCALAKAHEKISSLERTSGELVNRIDLLDGNTVGDSSQTAKEVQDVKEAQASIDEAVRSLQDSILVLENDKEDRRGQTLGIQSDVLSLQKQVQTLQAKEENEGQTASIQQLIEQVAAVKARVDCNVEPHIAQLKKEIAAEREQLNEKIEIKAVEFSTKLEIFEDNLAKSAEQALNEIQHLEDQLRQPKGLTYSDLSDKFSECAETPTCKLSVTPVGDPPALNLRRIVQGQIKVVWNYLESQLMKKMDYTEVKERLETLINQQADQYGALKSELSDLGWKVEKTERTEKVTALKEIDTIRCEIQNECLLLKQAQVNLINDIQSLQHRVQCLQLHSANTTPIDIIVSNANSTSAASTPAPPTGPTPPTPPTSVTPATAAAAAATTPTPLTTTAITNTLPPPSSVATQLRDELSNAVTSGVLQHTVTQHLQSPPHQQPQTTQQVSAFSSDRLPSRSPQRSSPQRQTSLSCNSTTGGGNGHVIPALNLPAKPTTQNELSGQSTVTHSHCTHVEMSEIITTVSQQQPTPMFSSTRPTPNGLIDARPVKGQQQQTSQQTSYLSNVTPPLPSTGGVPTDLLTRQGLLAGIGLGTVSVTGGGNSGNSSTSTTPRTSRSTTPTHAGSRSSSSNALNVATLLLTAQQPMLQTSPVTHTSPPVPSLVNSGNRPPSNPPPDVATPSEMMSPSESHHLNTSADLGGSASDQQQHILMGEGDIPPTWQQATSPTAAATGVSSVLGGTTLPPLPPLPPSTTATPSPPTTILTSNINNNSLMLQHMHPSSLPPPLVSPSNTNNNASIKSIVQTVRPSSLPTSPNAAPLRHVRHMRGGREDDIESEHRWLQEVEEERLAERDRREQAKQGWVVQNILRNDSVVDTHARELDTRLSPSPSGRSRSISRTESNSDCSSASGDSLSSESSGCTNTTATTGLSSTTGPQQQPTQNLATSAGATFYTVGSTPHTVPISTSDAIARRTEEMKRKLHNSLYSGHSASVQ